MQKIRFNADRDLLWFTGDLVNRGPDSLAVLRRVRALAANTIVVLGNHDLHLLAAAWVSGHRLRRGDTLDEILQARDRDTLLGWLLERPLAHHDRARHDLLVHAGVLPQWHAHQAAQLADEVSTALQLDPQRVLAQMYGDEPDQWDESLSGVYRWRLIINALTRLRVCTAQGQMDLRQKGGLDGIKPPWMPWFQVPDRASAATRVVFGHWSALGFFRGADVLALDTGCVWGDSLTAVNLDDDEAPPVAVRARSAASAS